MSKYQVEDILSNNGSPMYKVTSIDNYSYELSYTPDYTFLGNQWNAKTEYLDSLESIKLHSSPKKKREFQEEVAKILAESDVLSHDEIRKS